MYVRLLRFPWRFDKYKSLSYRDAVLAGFSWRENFGSASLLYEKEDVLFPEFKEVDLRSKYGGITLANFLIPEFPVPVQTVIYVVAQLLYSAGFECSSFQATPGKRVFKLVVTDASGDRMNFVRALVSNAANGVCAFTLGVGNLMIAFTAKKQGLHDKIGDCLVLKKAVVSTR